jgi:hypothetical protein
MCISLITIVDYNKGKKEIGKHMQGVLNFCKMLTLKYVEVSHCT